MGKSQNYHLPYPCSNAAQESRALLSVGMLHGTGAVAPPVLTKRLKASGTVLLSWCCFCRLQGYFEVYGKANLPVCMVYFSFVPKEVPGAEAGSEFPACFSAWQFWGEILCSKMLSGGVSHLRLSPHHALWLETPPFPHPTEFGALPSPAMQ